MKERKEKVTYICKVSQPQLYKILRPHNFKFLQQLVRKQNTTLKALAKALFGCTYKEIYISKVKEEKSIGEKR